MTGRFCEAVLLPVVMVCLLAACHAGGGDSGAATAPPVTARGASPPAQDNWPRYTLKAEQFWQFNLPDAQTFDASGLLLTPACDLLTVKDRGASLFRIQFKKDAPDADLILLPDCFTREQLAPFKTEKQGRYDCEGIAQDAQGRLYLCEEANRWVLRWDQKTRRVERLDIDWSPVAKYFHPVDRNASFEGIAVHGSRLYVANERQIGRLIVVDLNTLKVIDDFSVHPAGLNARDVHFTDLCWFDDSLWVLLRESHMVLRVNPDQHEVLAEFDFTRMEQAAEVKYRTILPVGTMEGLAVDENYVWLVTDNNGLPRVKYPEDNRPTLFKCPRPDRKK